MWPESLNLWEGLNLITRKNVCNQIIVTTSTRKAINTKNKQELQVLDQKASGRKIPKFSWAVARWENKSSFLGLWMFSLMGQTTGLYITITDCLSGLSEKLLKWLPLVHPITEEITEYVTKCQDSNVITIYYGEYYFWLAS